jgi:hypothetical protein
LGAFDQEAGRNDLIARARRWLRIAKLHLVGGEDGEVKGAVRIRSIGGFVVE